MAAGAAVFLHPAVAGRPLVVMRRVGTEEVNCHYPASNTRLEADPEPLGLAEWWLEVGCWPPKSVIRKYYGCYHQWSL